jgi:hypothetical protein
MSNFQAAPGTGNWFKQGDNDDSPLIGYWMTLSGTKLILKVGNVSKNELVASVGTEGGLMALGPRASDGSRVGTVLVPGEDVVKVRSIPHAKNGVVKNVFVHMLDGSVAAPMSKEDF